MTEPMSDPLADFAVAPRWAAGPEPETWRFLLPNGREVGWVEPSHGSVASCKLPWHWWSHPQADPRLDRAEGWSYDSDAARRACQAWVAGRLTGGVEDERGEG